MHIPLSGLKVFRAELVGGMSLRNDISRKDLMLAAAVYPSHLAAWVVSFKPDSLILLPLLEEPGVAGERGLVEEHMRARTCRGGVEVWFSIEIGSEGKIRRGGLSGGKSRRG